MTVFAIVLVGVAFISGIIAASELFTNGFMSAVWAVACALFLIALAIVLK